MLLCTRMHAHTLRAHKHTQINIKINLKTKEKPLKTEKMGIKYNTFVSLTLIGTTERRRGLGGPGR